MSGRRSRSSLSQVSAVLVLPVRWTVCMGSDIQVEEDAGKLCVEDGWRTRDSVIEFMLARWERCTAETTWTAHLLTPSPPINSGIPDEPRYLRPAIYHILLNLPPRSSILPSYTSFLSEISSRISALPSPTGEKLGKEDQLLREIERDVERTFGELAWFGGVDEAGGERDALWDRLQLLDAADRDLARDSRRGTPDPNVVEEEKEGAKSETAEDSATTAEEPVRSPRPRTRRQALLRPLYIYSTLNPGVSYVQGMNSIVAVLSWILSASGESPLEVEASTFFALGSMLSQLRDLYVRSLDGAMSPQSPQPASNGGASMGLGATLSRYTSLLTW
jgi:hypothetical protein